MPIDKTPWTDKTVMPWGKHKGQPLDAIPASYLLWLYEQPWIKDWPGLHAYLKANEVLILEEQQTNDDEGAGGYASYDEFREDFRGF